LTTTVARNSRDVRMKCSSVVGSFCTTVETTKTDNKNNKKQLPRIYDNLLSITVTLGELVANTLTTRKQSEPAHLRQGNVVR